MTIQFPPPILVTYVPNPQYSKGTRSRKSSVLVAAYGRERLSAAYHKSSEPPGQPLARISGVLIATMEKDRDFRGSESDKTQCFRLIAKDGGSSSAVMVAQLRHSDLWHLLPSTWHTKQAPSKTSQEKVFMGHTTRYEEKQEHLDRQKLMPTHKSPLVYRSNHIATHIQGTEGAGFWRRIMRRLVEDILEHKGIHV